MKKKIGSILGPLFFVVGIVLAGADTSNASAFFGIVVNLSGVLIFLLAMYIINKS